MTLTGAGLVAARTLGCSSSGLGSGWLSWALCGELAAAPQLAAAPLLGVLPQRQSVSSLLAAIERDWLRTQADVRFLDAGSFCQTWWRGFDGRLSVGAFEQRWARSPAVFCVLVGEPPAQPGDADVRELNLRLSLSGPVPLPP